MAAPVGSTVEEVAAHRLAAQRLTGHPLPSAADAVRHLLAVQCQDAPLSAWSLGMRAEAPTYAAVLAEQGSGAFVRTHVLRPTWHFVAAEDLRWLLALTSAKVLAGMAARHRQLGLDDDRVVGAAVEALAELLVGRNAMTRKAIGPLLAAQGHPGPGERLAHLLLVAELQGVICSGPLGGRSGREHTYVLAEEWLPARACTPEPADRVEALVWLVRRFLAGHGPAAVSDVVRWAAVKGADVRRGLDGCRDTVSSVVVEGTELWFPTQTPPRRRHDGGAGGRGPANAFLLPTFDEALLTFVAPTFPRPDGHPLGASRITPSAVGGGAVVVDGHDLGRWRRVVGPKRIAVTIDLAPGTSAAVRRRVEPAADRLAEFFELPRR